MSQAETIKTEKPKCRLLIERVLTESKAKRVFYLYKPKEIVVGEDYLVGLSLRNEGNTTFNGGKIEATLSAPIIGGGDLVYDLQQVVPVIPPKESRSVWFESQTAEISGTAMLSIKKIVPIGEDAVVECYDRFGNNMINTTKVITLQIASREEIYQKYSVVGALFFSIIALAVSIINAVVSIISLLFGH